MECQGSIRPKDVNIVSEPIEFPPKYAALWEEDEAKATEWLVNWFAGWCLLQRTRFRRFTIITTNEKSEAAINRYKLYQHIVVWTPERYLRYKKK